MTNKRTDTFCILPWTHMATLTDGSATLCCIAQNSNMLNLNNHTISEIWNSEHFKEARVKMLNGEKVDACKHCYKEEESGIKSHRMHENFIWEETLGTEYVNGLLASTKSDGYLEEDLITFDFRLGNTCNLQCVMCRPQDSSMWLNPAKKLFETLETDAKWDWQHKLKIDTSKFDWYKREKIWEDFKYIFPNIKHLIFAGGEPLLIKEHKKLLQRLVEEGYSKNIELRYHTNCTILPDEIIELWENFKLVDLMLSIDAWGSHHDYVRYPANWDTILQNLNKLENTSDVIEIKVLTTIHAMNIFYIPEFAENLLAQNYKKVGKFEYHHGLFHPGTVHWPQYLSTTMFPQNIKEKIREKWDSYSNLNKNKQWDRKIRRQLDFMDSEDKSELFPQFLDYIEKLDAIRSTKFEQIFPEFWSIING